MPFNGTGTFTILNTFLPGTTILSTPVNANFTDIAGGLSDCLTRDGQAGMTAQFKALSGAVGTPGITFSSDLTTGAYLAAAGTMGLVGAGNEVATVDPLGFRLNDAISDTGVISPASLSTDQNDYAPTGIDTASTLRLTSSTAVSITGMAGMHDGTFPTTGRKIKLVNIGSNKITLVANSGSSLTQNQFKFPSNFSLFGGQACELLYDITSTAWRMLASFQFSSAAPQGNCRLKITSTTVVTLVPYKGNFVSFPSGDVAIIPSAGISSTYNNASINGTAAQTLSNTTLYYAYLWNSDGLGTYVIDWSTTSHSTDTSTGIEIKTGDATRVLVGMAYLVGANFLESGANRLVASWFNQRQVAAVGAFTANRTTTSTTFAELNSEIRCNFLAWAGSVTAGYAGSVSNSGNNITQSLLSLDSSSGTSGGFAGQFQPSAGFTPMGMGSAVNVAEGFHFITILGAVAAGTGTWQSNASHAQNGILTTTMVH